jgi:hypothetical protein
MKKLILIAAAALSLSACATTGNDKPDLGTAPPAKMPDLPDTMARKAERLPDMTDPSLGGIHKSGIDADTSYNELAVRYNALVDAWDCVKKGLEARDEKLAQQCLKDAGKQ